MDSKLMNKLVLAKKFISMNFTMTFCLLASTGPATTRIKDLTCLEDKTWKIVSYKFVD